jgi:protein-S-isoprenylcysteine O-methyltransferase Ste14
MTERRGQVWVAVQFVLFCGILATPFFGRFAAPVWLRPLGALVLIEGIAVMVAGYRALGRSHSPWTTPIAGGALVRTGIYRHMRHPIYSGWILLALGWALLWGSSLGLWVAVAILIYYDLRTREEEKWLRQRYADYVTYAQQVKRFIPGLY